MSYNVKTISVFEKQTKRLFKKYPSLNKDLLQLVELLKQYPEQGKPLGRNCFKIRISISSKSKGKSGGGRVITNFILMEKTVYLLAIYDKAEKETLTDKELDELLKYIPV